MTIKQYIDDFVNDYEYLSDEAFEEESNNWLDIKTVIDYGNAQTVHGYIITITIGGPNIFLDTYRGEMYGSWGSDTYSTGISSELCERVHELLAL